MQKQLCGGSYLPKEDVSLLANVRPPISLRIYCAVFIDAVELFEMGVSPKFLVCAEPMGTPAYFLKSSQNVGIVWRAYGIVLIKLASHKTYA